MLAPCLVCFFQISLWSLPLRLLGVHLCSCEELLSDTGLPLFSTHTASLAQHFWPSTHMTVPRFCPPVLPVWPDWPLKSSRRPAPPTVAFLLSIVVSKCLPGTLAHSTDPKHEGPILFLFLIHYLGLFNPCRKTETKVTLSKSRSLFFSPIMSTMLKKPVMQMLKKQMGSSCTCAVKLFTFYSPDPHEVSICKNEHAKEVLLGRSWNWKTLKIINQEWGEK